MMLKFDEYSLEQVAEDLQVLNPDYVKPVTGMIADMKSMANLYLDKSTYFRTNGYVLTAYPINEDTKMVFASVDGGMAKKLGERLAKAEKMVRRMKYVLENPE